MPSGDKEMLLFVSVFNSFIFGPYNTVHASVQLFEMYTLIMGYSKTYLLESLIVVAYVDSVIRRLGLHLSTHAAPRCLSGVIL